MSTCTSIRYPADRSIYRVLVTLTLILTLTGCASLENAADHAHDFAVRHPIATAIGTAVVVGGAVAAIEAGHHHRHHEPAVGPERPTCGRTAC